MGTIRTSPGAVLPRDMNSRQWSEYAGQMRTQYYRDGQTDYDTGTGFWIGLHNGVPKLSIGNSAGNKVTWDGTDLSIVGDLVLGSGNFLRSGQTAYDTGTGFWIGNDGGTPKLSVGDSSGNKLTWNGSALSVTGSINLTNSTQAFTPTWNGFSSDPSGDISYLDLGKIVWMWVDTALTGASDEAFMTLTGVPAGIRPAANRYCRCFLLDESNLRGGVAVVGSGGAMTFSLETVEASPTDTIGFSDVFTDPSSLGSKGLPAGWLIQYPK